MVMGQLPGAEGATIVDQGTYDELVGRGRDLSNILEEQKAKKKPAESEVCVCVCVCLCIFIHDTSSSENRLPCAAPAPVVMARSSKYGFYVPTHPLPRRSFSANSQP